MDSLYYTLDENENVVPCDQEEWCKVFKSDRRIVNRSHQGAVTVSTVFLGLEHGFSGDKPILFETMAFNAPDGEEHMRRYTTIEEARAGHEEVCAEVFRLEDGE